LEAGIDRIMFATDYPYASMPDARSFLDRLAVSPADKERIAHRNAEALLGLQPFAA
jgi:predicted TIM-barrel fold metal-dependent hydrolase